MSTAAAPTHEDHLAVARQLSADVLEPMKRLFVGKDEIIDLMGIGLVARENLFLFGPPGTAKSALVSELGRQLSGKTFEYLLTKFTEPNELFGPFDIRRLREGELVTNTEGMLPEASLVFLDELLNANSAILNALLGVLNERVFRRGRETRALPTLMVLGASNRLPEDEALAALFDRFLIRVRCDNVSDNQLNDVLSAGWKLDLGLHPPRTSIDMEQVRSLHGALKLVELGEARPALMEAVLRLRTAGIAVSDRRAVKLQRLIAASAILSGRMTARTSDLWVLRYIWDTVEQQEILASVVKQVVKASAVDAGDHPLARSNDTPDPEALGKNLATLAEQVPSADATARSVIADRLSIIAAHVQWIKNEVSRETLQTKVDELWGQLRNNP